jgi:hypothetical protein
MIQSPYRSPCIGSPSLQPIRSTDPDCFIEMPALRGALCADMYGDLPYGLLVAHRCTIRGDAGYFFNSDMTPLLEQNAGFLRKGKFVRPRFEEVTQPAQDGVEVADLISLVSRCDSYFWHWMLDSLPKVLIAEDSGFRGLYLIPEPTRAPWAVDSLALLGIPLERIIIKSAADLHAERLYVPTYFCGNNAHLNTPLLQLFRERIRNSVPSPSKQPQQRIFIGRRLPSRIRRVVNQDALEVALSRFGFTTIYLEELPLREQLALARRSTLMMGPHGSGLTHSLFMDEHSTLIELFPYKRMQASNCYETLARIPSLSYRAIDSTPRNDGDIEIDPNALLEIIRELL